MKKKDLQRAAGINSGLITKLGKNEAVTTTVLGEICEALNCNIYDIIDMMYDDE